MCVSFCVAATCVGFPQPPKLTLCVAGLCTPVSAPGAGLCRKGLIWTCFGSLCPPSVLQGLCALVSSRCLHSLSLWLFVLLSIEPGRLCALPKFVCLPSISTPDPPIAPAVSAGIEFGTWTHPLCFKRSALLAGFVCPTTLGSWSPSSVWSLSP